MRLQNELYEIIDLQREGERMWAEIRLNASHFIYRAHFPNEPITPGVCIIQIARELLENYLERNLQITEVKNVKFLSVISPIETPRVTYSFEKISDVEGESAIKSQVIVFQDDNQYAKISMTCK